MLRNDPLQGEVIEIRVEGQGPGQEFLSVPRPGLWGRCYPSLIPPCWGWDRAALAQVIFLVPAAPSAHPHREESTPTQREESHTHRGRSLRDCAAHEEVWAFGTEKHDFLETTAWRRAARNSKQQAPRSQHGKGVLMVKRRNAYLRLSCAIQDG